MQITVLGANGQTGTAVVDQALAQGHQVTALVRDRSKITRTDAGLTVVEGDARDADDVAKALVGSEAVISTLGSMKAKDELLSRASAALVTAATAADVKRVVVMSTFVAAPQFKRDLMGKLMSSMMKSVVADKSQGEARLEASSLDWTFVYPTGLDKAPAGQPVRVVGTDEQVSSKNGIARADVATFLLAEAVSNAHVRQRVVITTK
jgi:putative NADH-flavin reductase